MNNAAEKTALLILLFVLLSLITTKIQSEVGGKINPSTFDKQISNTTLSTNVVLEHNRWLLEGTTIGVTLLNSPNLQARKLYTQATVLHKKARTTFETGQKDLAKNIAYQSIQAFYRSDRLHYNIVDN